MNEQSPIDPTDRAFSFIIRDSNGYDAAVVDRVLTLNSDLKQGNNRFARVRRTYHPSGAIKTDSIVFGLYSSPLTDDVARGQIYSYDLAGRRTSMVWYFGDVNTYSYNDFGALDSIIAPHNDVYRMKYDLKGQIDSLILGTGTKEKRTYDADGRMLTKNRISTYGTLGTLVSDVFGYDKMNRVISISEQVGQQGTEQTRISYDGPGAVLAKEQSIATGGARAEEFRNDAFGNVIRRRSRSTAGLINDVPFINQYSPIGELLNSFAQVSNPPGQYEREDELKQQFAAGGQLIRQDQLVRDPNTGTVTLHAAARHYYGADDRLMAVQRYSYRSTAVGDGTWEEYWYDALGRRVLTRARRDASSAYPAATSGPLCSGTNICRSYKERVSWDGDQALVEDRAPEGTSDVSNSGVVRNVHGQTLDEPLSVIADAIRIPNYNWRGQAMSNVFLNGSAGDITLGYTATEVDWPAATQAETYFAQSPGANPSTNPKRWLGTFVANGQGTTGMLYRRNRYFDPKSGQFTQADPTGIATGMNVFGFASGDPINFSDPFGLCTPEPLCPRGPVRPMLALGGLFNAVGQAAEEFREKYGADILEAGAMVLSSRGGGFNSRTTARTTMGRTRTRVDVELPGTHGPGNVHVQTKGPGGNQKYPIANPEDLSGLPRALRENETIRRGIEKAFDLLERFKR